MKFTDKQIEEEIESYDNCPPVYQGAIAYPYEILGDRKFEVLLYSIFKRRSKGVNNKSRFDDIALMTGVGEQGRDCALFYHGDSVGLIQCKHSINPAVRVDKPTVACEIIKFILSYLLDRSLITDVSDFTYYFAVSSDFTGPALDLLGDFNRTITEDPDFRKWVEETILSYKRFEGLSFDQVAPEVSMVLKTINVAKITAQDLNNELAGKGSLVGRFFSVQKVISEESALLMESHMPRTPGWPA